MDLPLIFILILCFGGMILLLLIPFQIIISGSLTPDNWYIMVSFWPLKIMLVPDMRLNLFICDRLVRSFNIPAISGNLDKKHEKGTIGTINFQSLLKLPISIHSVSLKGNIGCRDSADTGRMFGWISALSGMLSWTRFHINLIPDFTGSSFSVLIKVKIRIRSVFHIILYLARMNKRSFVTNQKSSD